MSNNDDFWLISVPGEKTPQESWERLSKNIQPISNVFKFNIPGLKVYIWNKTNYLYVYSKINSKVGTLDQLFGLSDELSKMDSFVESYDRFFCKLKIDLN